MFLSRTSLRLSWRGGTCLVTSAGGAAPLLVMPCSISVSASSLSRSSSWTYWSLPLRCEAQPLLCCKWSPTSSSISISSSSSSTARRGRPRRRLFNSRALSRASLLSLCSLSSWSCRVSQTCHCSSTLGVSLESGRNCRAVFSALVGPLNLGMSGRL